ncbi:helitron helicase-like domain-containing protein [Artemisia annua]|uniref:Helitron helicase-like domain-containing protein n=1 Tax=Artemisia annua TaxID=35608 RepID=A0A2U1KJI5_ARTAN|nr:helitron helicase-like domain-containing protein [Artemisia annua]
MVWNQQVGTANIISFPKDIPSVVSGNLVQTEPSIRDLPCEKENNGILEKSVTKNGSHKSDIKGKGIPMEVSTKDNQFYENMTQFTVEENTFSNASQSGVTSKGSKRKKETLGGVRDNKKQKSKGPHKSDIKGKGILMEVPTEDNQFYENMSHFTVEENTFSNASQPGVERNPPVHCTSSTFEIKDTKKQLLTEASCSEPTKENRDQRIKTTITSRCNSTTTNQGRKRKSHVPISVNGERMFRRDNFSGVKRYSEDVSSLYIDLGDLEWSCEYCGARFWYGERIKRTGHTNLKAEIVEGLMHTLDAHNELVQIFRTARDKCNDQDVPDMKIQLYNVVGARQYQLPTSGTRGAIIFGNASESMTDYDVIIEYRDRRPKRINKLHSSYMSLQFPILFVYGQPGYNTKMEVTDKVLEVKVYRAWIHWDPPNTTEKGFRAILLDKQGHAIQANMEAPEINHFKGILIPGKTYRVYNFTCVPTENWQQILTNPVSLSFTTSIAFDAIDDDGFPNHYFDFVSYSQLPSRVIDPMDKTKKPQPILTGCYISSTKSDKIGNPNKNRAAFRKIEIQNLNFNKEEIDAMEKPVIIAVSSCRVSRFRNNLQLSATPATYYYIDPDIPELQQYREAFNLNPPLQIIRQPFKDKEREKFCNRYPLAVLMSEPLNLIKVHGPVESPANRYNFKAYITDNTHTVMMTFFTPKGNDVVGTDCDTLFHFNTGAKQGPHEFIVNGILDKDDKPKQIEAGPSGSTLQEKEADIVDYPETVQEAITPITGDIPATEPENIDPSKDITIEEEQSEGMMTPPSEYKGMQTRSKTEAMSETSRKAAKRPLFLEDQPESKKKKN